MAKAVDDLIQILEKQIRNYHDLKQLILEKRKAIVGNNLKNLSEITSQIQSLIASNNKLEMDRMAPVEKMASELGISDSKPTLAQIAEYLESPFSEKLLRLRREAIDSIKDVQRQNRINSEMLKYCANLMDSVLRSMLDEEPYEPTYGSSGQANKKTISSSLMDQHA